MNRVILFGNLGADPELRMTNSGQAVLKLRMATTKRFKNRDGQWQEATEWHRVIMWGPRAENLSRHLNKGSTILVEGELRTTSYDDRDGNKRYATEVYADDITFGGPRQRRDEYDQRPATEDTNQDAAPDSIPF